MNAVIEVFFLTLLVVFAVICIISFGAVLAVYIIAARNLKAINEIWKNPIHCGKPYCTSPSLNLEVPTQNTNSYNKKVALYCADLVHRVQKAADNNELSQPKHLTMVTKLWNLKKDPVFGVVWSYSYHTTPPPPGPNPRKIAFVVFRGTISSNMQEWSQDFQISQETFTKPQKKNSQSTVHFLRDVAVPPAVHSGFLDVYDKLRPSLLENLKKINPDQVIVAGHSLGAGVTTICALDLLLMGYKTVAYALASPRVGDNTFANLVDSSKLPLFRVVNSSDLVTTLPPSVSPNFGNANKPFIYTHCGELIHFTDNWESYFNNHLLPVYIKFLQT